MIYFCRIISFFMTYYWNFLRISSVDLLHPSIDSGDKYYRSNYVKNCSAFFKIINTLLYNCISDRSGFYRNLEVIFMEKYRRLGSMMKAEMKWASLARRLTKYMI